MRWERRIWSNKSKSQCCSFGASIWKKLSLWCIRCKEYTNQTVYVNWSFSQPLFNVYQCSSCQLSELILRTAIAYKQTTDFDEMVKWRCLNDEEMWREWFLLETEIKKPDLGHESNLNARATDCKKMVCASTVMRRSYYWQILFSLIYTCDRAFWKLCVDAVLDATSDITIAITRVSIGSGVSSIHSDWIINLSLSLELSASDTKSIAREPSGADPLLPRRCRIFSFVSPLNSSPMTPGSNSKSRAGRHLEKLPLTTADVSKSIHKYSSASPVRHGDRS